HTVSHALIQGGLVMVWAQSAAVMIRPVWVWQGFRVPEEAMIPLQQQGWVLALVAAVLGAVRMVIELKAQKGAGGGRNLAQLRTGLARAEQNSSRIPFAVALLLKAGLSTLFLSGLVTRWWEFPELAALFCIFFWMRARASLRFAVWWRIVGKIPVLLRAV